jgi:hypothetical protein
MKKYRFTSAALSELKEASAYDQQKENGLGIAFLDEIDATVERILRFSHACIPSLREPDDFALTGSRSECYIKFDLMKFLSPP